MKMADDFGTSHDNRGSTKCLYKRQKKLANYDGNSLEKQRGAVDRKLYFLG